jgi:hypothetical protein
MPSIHDSEKRTCMGICKQYKVTKPAGRGRYESGQARCQTCDIWIDHNGCVLKSRLAATIDSVGWICKCCNYRVRQKPRNLKYKEKLREKIKDKNN